MEDDTAPWNARTWKLEAVDGDIHVTESREEPQFSLDIQTLTQAMFGSPSLSALHQADRVQVKDPAGLAVLGRLLQGPPVWLNNSF